MEHCDEIDNNFVYEQIARLGKAIAAPARLKLLHLLCHSPRTVQVLAEQADMSVANTSRHLQVLHNAKLVECEKSGLHVTYRIADDSVSELLLALRDVAGDRLAEFDRLARHLVEDVEGVEPTTAAEFVDRRDDEDPLVLDLRPHEEYLAGHIPGAMSIPYGEFDPRKNVGAQNATKKIFYNISNKWRETRWA